jgi:hypothetical protein
MTDLLFLVVGGEAAAAVSDIAIMHVVVGEAASAVSDIAIMHALVEREPSPLPSQAVLLAYFSLLLLLSLLLSCCWNASFMGCCCLPLAPITGKRAWIIWCSVVQQQAHSYRGCNGTQRRRS